MKIVYCKFTFIIRGDEHASSCENSVVKRTNAEGISKHFHFVEHALQSIDTLVEEHRKYTAAQALYGDKIVGSEERSVQRNRT